MLTKLFYDISDITDAPGSSNSAGFQSAVAGRGKRKFVPKALQAGQNLHTNVCAERGCMCLPCIHDHDSSCAFSRGQTDRVGLNLALSLVIKPTRPSTPEKSQSQEAGPP